MFALARKSWSWLGAQRWAHHLVLIGMLTAFGVDPCVSGAPPLVGEERRRKETASSVLARYHGWINTMRLPV